MKTLPVILISIALCSVAAAQDASKKITFECKAGPADQVFKQLSKEAGVTFGADPALRKEILLISVKDATLPDLMAKLAAVTAGQWMTVAGEYHLVPESGLRRKQQDAWLAARVKFMKDLLDENARTSEIPLTLLSLQDPAALAQLAPGQRVVFSSSPNSEQLQVAGLTNDMVDKALQQASASSPTELLNRAYQQRQQGQAQGQGQNQGEGGSNQQGQGQNTQQGPPTVVLLTVANTGAQLDAHLVMYDEKGYSRGDLHAALSLHGIPVHVEEPASDSKAMSARSDAIKMSPLTASVWGAGFDHQSGRLDQLTKEGQEAMLRPDQVEPLSLLCSDALLQRAHECGENMVADLPDCVAWAKKEGTAKEYLAARMAEGSLQVTDKDGWISISPADPIADRFYRADRKALAQLIDSAHSRGYATLDDLAAFAVAEGYPPIEPGGALDHDISPPYLHTFVPEWTDLQVAGNHYNFLLLYAGLAPAQKEELLGGKPLLFGNLSSESQNALKEIVFGAETALNLEEPRAFRTPNQVEFQSYRGSYGRFVQSRVIPGQTVITPRLPDYLKEPTEALPNGMLAEGTVRIDAGNSPSQGQGVAINGETARFRFQVLPPVWQECTISVPRSA